MVTRLKVVVQWTHHDSLIVPRGGSSNAIGSQGLHLVRQLIPLAKLVFAYSEILNASMPLFDLLLDRKQVRRGAHFDSKVQVVPVE